MKPMLATKLEIKKLQFPVVCSPKLDGIRCVIHEGQALTRSLKPIPNLYVREMLSYLPNGLDGELMIHGDFNEVQSAIMSRDGEPDFYYVVFDSFVEPKQPYWWRIDYAAELLEGAQFFYGPNRVNLIKSLHAHNEAQVMELMDRFVSQGFEGLMTRDPDGVYKFGRSTVKEGYLLKMKRFHDEEAILVDIVEKMHNENPKELDELGHSKRSSKKENLVPAGTAGALVVRWRDKVFNLGFGIGFNDIKKKKMWDKRHILCDENTIITFSYQELSSKGVPRFPKAIKIRSPLDL